MGRKLAAGVGGQEQTSAPRTRPCPHQVWANGWPPPHPGSWGHQGEPAARGRGRSPDGALTQTLPDSSKGGGVKTERGEGLRQAESLPELLPRSHRGKGTLSHMLWIPPAEPGAKG